MDPEIEDLAKRNKLKYETVEDLINTGWEYRSEYTSVPMFVHPLANMHKPEVFSLLKRSRNG